MLSQLLAMFGLSSVVLVLIYWVNRAVRLFDWLIASGQSATVFLEFTALTLPNVIRIVLPISAFVAALYTTNRLSAESELVVVQATGFGPFRMARPILIFGLFVGGCVALLVHLAVPASFARLAERQVEIAENVTARLLVEGQFVHPADALTLYIRDISGSGQLGDVYLDDRREPDRPVTYTATHASLVRTETGPRLVMYDGMAQTLSRASRTLSVTRFQELALNVSTLIAPDAEPPGRRSIREASTAELLRADPEAARALHSKVARMLAEGHQRIAQSVMAVAVPLIGFAVLILGGFSRFGIWNHIFAAIVVVVLLWLVDNAASEAAGRSIGAWPLAYLPGLAGLALAGAILWAAANPQHWRRRRRSAPA